MAGQKVAWVVIVASVAFMVWMRGRNKELAERSELHEWLQHRGLQEVYPMLEEKGRKNPRAV